jgi:hypothetical protein
MISTKDIPTGGGGKVSKTLQPGNTTIKVNAIYLEEFRFAEGAYNIMLDCEGVDMGETFEGFFIDKANTTLGRHKGQVGRVRASQWAYQDKDLGEIKINRDIEIVKFLGKFCDAVGCTDWLEKEDGKHETVESLVKALSEAAPFADKFLKVCLCGKEYENKQGYTNFDLFFPKFKDGVPFENEEVEENVSRVLTFDKASHIITKKAPMEIIEFPAANPDDIMTGVGGTDFEL